MGLYWWLATNTTYKYTQYKVITVLEWAESYKTNVAFSILTDIIMRRYVYTKSLREKAFIREDTEILLLSRLAWMRNEHASTFRYHRQIM